MYNLIPQMVQENKKLKRQSQLLLSQVGGQVNLVSGLLTEIIIVCFASLMLIMSELTYIHHEKKKIQRGPGLYQKRLRGV